MIHQRDNTRCLQGAISKTKKKIKEADDFDETTYFCIQLMDMLSNKEI